MEREKENKLPAFQSLDEEKEYWEIRGPLAEGRKGRINKPKSDQKRSSFLSVRLTGEEITDLRDVATILHTTPSALARSAILDSVIRFRSLYAMHQEERKRLEEALRHGAFNTSNKPIDLRDKISGTSLEDAHLFWKHVIEENPKLALCAILLILEDLLNVSGADKPISITAQALFDRLSSLERVIK